ncbi:unnamed protein product [Effrenium voratum]|uniref:Uncharacterized protein n=1 Tax=Effrenium voratum TaxID=2562239 RepID=A0AA36NJL0_9DINO|nr:unnamed protein product [Effrenium voratum]
MHARGSMMVRCDLCNFDACTGCVKGQAQNASVQPLARSEAPVLVPASQPATLAQSPDSRGQNISEWPAIPEDEVQEAAEPSPSAASGPEVGGWDPASPKLENLPQFTSFHIKR